MNFGDRLRVIVALSLGPAVANSFARFAYALVLPAMRSDLGLTYAQAGALNTANALGYLAGAVLSARYVSRLGNRRLFRIGMWVTVGALVASGVAGDFAWQLFLRAIAGVSGAMAFICGAVLATNASSDRPERASSAIAIYFGGAGAGILLTGAGIPWLLAAMGDSAWRTAWLAIGAVSAAFAIVAVRGAARIDEPASGEQARGWAYRALTPAIGSYFLFGAGYIAYMTFVVAWMVSHGATALDVSLTWGTLGVATMIAPLAWRTPRARWHPSRSLAAAGLVLAAGAAIPLVSTSQAAMVLSAFLFGMAMFTAPASVADLVKHALPKAVWGTAIAMFTVIFAVGQAIGPVLTGWLADLTHSLHAGLTASVVILLVASGTAMLQPGSEIGTSATARA